MLRMLEAGLKRVLVRDPRIDRPGGDKRAERRDRVEVPFPQQLNGVVRHVVVGQAAATLMGPRQHRGRELALRLDIK